MSKKNFIVQELIDRGMTEKEAINKLSECQERIALDGEDAETILDELELSSDYMEDLI